ncbi:MAG: hypothetical protein K0S46_2486 [Moraxellaceae bacterium]|jgi:hypothetical protein|nr:hypothetical protein [Moraxellaceae bacterium]
MPARLIALALFVLAPGAHAAKAGLPSIPPELALAETAGPHRLLAFQACSEENCWHQMHVQALGLSPQRKILCSVPVAALNRGENVMVSNAAWRPGPYPVLELSLHSPQDEFAPYVATLAFARDCKYELRPPAPPALYPPTGAATGPGGKAGAE